jgi:ATP/ADP translocase
MNAASQSSRSVAERALVYLLRPFAKVEPVEAITAAVLMLTVFLLLTAYYLLKTAREPLILLHGGAEVKQYAAAGQTLVLVVVLNAYSALAHRVSSRVEKYVGKTVIDTVIVRAGDALTSVVVLAGSRAAMSTQAFATLNLVLISVWVAAVFAVGRENARRSGESEERIAAEPLPS